jgi:dihydroorotate dehydrogenase
LSGLPSIGARALGLIDPETAHGLALRALRAGLGGRDSAAPDPILATRLAGMALENPVGLAAGFDKDAVAPAALLSAGFGFVECGTTTPRPQVGNPRPRLFRLREDGAVINRMGFNNAGLERFAANLAAPRRGVVGANIGANKDSADRVADYLTGLERLWGLADYFTLNISSPNTPGLRELQGRAALDDMLARVAEARARLEAGGRPYQIFLKVAPDLEDADIEDIVEAAVRHRLAGLVVANTTLARPSSLRGKAKAEMGGLSGAPLMAASTALLGRFFEAAAGRLTLIGVGGVASGADAYAKIRAGADAVQLYTALAYRGPGLVREIGRDLADRLRADGFRSVGEAVGAR